jgi:hypothetical protein
MTKLVDTLFGDKGKGAAKQQSQQNAQERNFILGQTQKAQDLLQGMYPTMQQNSMLGSQAALTTMRNALPQTSNVRQQGTQNAIAALLGGQGSQIRPNFNFIPQDLPQYQTYQNPQAMQQPQQMQQVAGNNLTDAIMRQMQGGRFSVMGGK